MHNTYFPETIRIDITGECNLKCKHCQASMFLNKSSESLSTQKWKCIITELAKSGCITIGFLGGEPLLRKDIFEIMSHARSLGIKVTLTTNGILLTEKTISKLIELKCSVFISLDGHNPDTHNFIRGKGSFERTLRNLKKFRAKLNNENNNLLGISYVVCKSNISYHEEIFELCANLEIHSLSIAIVHNTGRAAENWQQIQVTELEVIDYADKVSFFIDLYKDRIDLRLDMFPPAYRDFISNKHSIKIPQDILSDNSGVKECYIQHDGRVFPSQPLSEMIPNLLKNAANQGFSFRYNSLINLSFEEIWNGSEFINYRNFILSRTYVEQLTPCNQCSFRYNYCQPSAAHYLKGEENIHILCTHAHGAIKQSTPLESDALLNRKL